MPRSHLTRPAVALLLSAASVAAFAPLGAAAPAKPGYGNNGNKGGAKEEVKIDPIVVKFEAAGKQRVNGTEMMMVSGIDALTGARRQFPVENQAPQDKTKGQKYDPKPRVADAVNAAKPGDFLKIEVKPNGSTLWAEKAEKFEPAEHEVEPGTYVLYEAFKDTVDGTDAYKVTLTKFGKYFECYAAMVPGEGGKGKIPDPQVVAGGDAATRKTVVEAVVVPQGNGYVVTALDAYQAPKAGKVGKLADADVNGQKAQAVELQGDDGQSATLPIAGKVNGKKWVPDAAVLVEARKVKAGTAVLYRTRDVGGKTFLRQIVAAPKETAKVAAKGGGGTDTMTPTKADKDVAADKKKK